MAKDPGLDALLRRSFEIVSRLVPVDAMFIALLGENGHYLKLLETDLDDKGHRVFCAKRPVEPNSSHVLATLDQHRYVLVNRTMGELKRLSDGAAGPDPWTPVGNPSRRSASLLFVPIWFGAKYAGALSVQSYSLDAYAEADAERLVIVAEYIGLALRHARLMAGPSTRAGADAGGRR